MKKIVFILISLIFYSSLYSQTEYRDWLLENSVYNNAPESIKRTKAFLREVHFFEQRAYPNNFIPSDAYTTAIEQRNRLREYTTNKTLNIQWSSLGPTPGYYTNYGNISSRIVTGTFDPQNPSVLYIGAANGGVWKSTNDGQTFQPLSDYEASTSMGAITIDPNNTQVIYAGTGEATYSGASYYGAGILKSTNGGHTWQRITSGLPSQTYTSRIVIRPNNSSHLLAAMGNSGLYRSVNSGQTWTQILAGRVDDVLFTPSGDTAFAVGSGIAIQRSINGGATFSGFGSNLPSGTRTHFDLCNAQPSIMYAAVYASSAVKVYKSTDFGVNWNQISTSVNFNGGQAWYDLYCRVNPENPNIAYVGCIDIFRTTDGSNFTNITNGYGGGYVHVDQHYLFFHPFNPNIIFVCNDGGIWKSTDGGNNFTNLNSSLTLTQFYRITASPFNSSRILGGTQDNGTQQTYGTINWAAAFGGDGGEVCFNPFNSNYIIGETQNGGLMRTANGGASWSSATSGISTSESVAWVAPIIAHPNIDGTFFTARTRIYKSTNNGSSWSAISSNVNGTTAVRELAICKSDPNVLFATSSSRVFRSTDGGVNWTNVTSGLPNKTITCVAIHPDSSNIVFLTFSGFGTDKVYKSTNKGSSWFSISSGLPDSPANDILIYPNDPNNVYFIATDVGVFMTRSAGASWEELYEGLPNTVIMHLDYSISERKLRAGTHGRGVYEAYIDFGSTTSTFSTNEGWNLISVPLQSYDMSKNFLFPNSNSSAYTFNELYLTVDTLKMGNGYWLKFPYSQSHNISGQIVSPFTFNVNSGWNIIGSTNNAISTSSVVSNPPGIISSQFYGYNNGYFPASTIEVGRGYWVKTNSAGSLTYSSLFKNVVSEINYDSFDKLTFEDTFSQIKYLYLTEDKRMNLDYFELPPLPPSNQVDVRFASNRLIEINVGKLEVLFQGFSYPIKLKFHSNSDYNLSLELSNGVIYTLSSGETFTISDPRVNSIFIERQKLVTKFELNQNYPNPFNPKTSIEFSLAKGGKVRLVLFNVLGEKLKVLIDKEMNAGNHRYELSIDEMNLDIPSGVYIYQLEAGGLKFNRKMILSK